jgi:hypothetical protein
MRPLPLLEVLVVNALLLALLLWITGDYGFRASYWTTEGFVSSIVRYPPLFFVTSAVKGSTSIPGLLTIDWQQIVVLMLVVTDAVYLSSLVRARRRNAPWAGQASVSTG